MGGVGGVLRQDLGRRWARADAVHADVPRRQFSRQGFGQGDDPTLRGRVHGLAAGACAGNGILLDIRDPAHPTRLDAVGDKNFAYWHSATFNNDGTKVIFTDEWGGGSRPRCRATDPLNWGADAIFDIVDKKLQFRSYYKMPAVQTEQENQDYIAQQHGELREQRSRRRGYHAEHHKP